MKMITGSFVVSWFFRRGFKLVFQANGILTRCYPVRSGHQVQFVIIVILVLLFSANPLLAQKNQSDDSKAKEQTNPPSIEFSLPIEIDFDYGADNGGAVISRFLPLIGFPMGNNWKLINLTLAVVANAPGAVPGRPGNPDPLPGGRVIGLGDLTNLVFVTPPSLSQKLVWGFGPAIGLPTATDGRLGSGKWSLGPAFRIAYRPGQWNLGVVAGNLTSFAGDTDRSDLNQLLIRGLIRRQLGSNWYFTNNPIITVNWKASGKKWLLPLGGGLGKSFKIGSKSVALAFHAYFNVIKPEGAPKGVFRISLVLPIPGSLQR